MSDQSAKPLTLDAIRAAATDLEALRPPPLPDGATPAELFVHAFAEAVLAGAEVRETTWVDQITVIRPHDGCARGLILHPAGGRAEFDALVERVNAAARRSA